MIVDYTDALYAGWRIFPINKILHTENGLRCDCGNADCEAIGKHPKISNWQHTPMWDEEQLSYMEDDEGMFFGNQFLDGYGIVISSSKLFVVDVDGRNGGFESAKKLQWLRDQCGFIVRSGSGNGEHWYFILDADTKLLTNHADYDGIDFKSSGYIVGCGSEHKSGLRYEVISGKPSEITKTPEKILKILERKERATSNTIAIDDKELLAVVGTIKNDERDYEKFIRVGMGIHDATNGSDEGYKLWVNWSEKNEAHSESQMPMKWRSFGKSASPVTAATLYTWAKEDGYVEPVTFDMQDDKPRERLPDIDLNNPPGFVGEITNWINSRSIFPREKLAVAAALQIVSNAAGLKYYVEGLNTNINIMTFGIAGSRTGKGRILDCVTECHQKIGLSGAVHGVIKSEQEIIRNAIRHQAVFYVYDEFGAMLSKLANARKKGSTPYLEGVLSTVMAIYSAAGSSFNISGDAKVEMREIAEKKLAKGERMVDDGQEDKGNRIIEEAKKQIERSEKGIIEPYLTFFAVSEPGSFHEAINTDPWVLTGGFLGRALIFEEIETVPVRKNLRDINNEPLNESLVNDLQDLYSLGHSDVTTRIERLGERVAITFDDEAEKLLSMIYDYWNEVACFERDTGSNLESQALGAPEITIKVAGVLSAKEGVITKEYLEWSHALVKKNTLMKISKAKSTKDMDSKNDKEKGAGLLDSILTTLSNSDKPLAIGTIKNRCGSSVTTENVQAGLDYLVKEGKIKSETKKAKNGRQFIYFSLLY